ncbi:MAG: hypothetical protein HY913_13750 [Desulfomonile tiedjei]|nr:hypothetical protein [Desulfomonile tiedjei]
MNAAGHVPKSVSDPTPRDATKDRTEAIMKCTLATTFRIPRLNSTKVKVAGKLPRVSLERLKPAAPVERQPVEAIVARPSPETVQKVERPSEAIIKVVPTPRKREIRPPRAKAAPLQPAPPKPLKVIRRRREEAPKIFETSPKSVPKAMLEGIDLDTETDADN